MEQLSMWEMPHFFYFSVPNNTIKKKPNLKREKKTIVTKMIYSYLSKLPFHAAFHFNKVILNLSQCQSFCHSLGIASLFLRSSTQCNVKGQSRYDPKKINALYELVSV